jgi:hypothetical protein
MKKLVLLLAALICLLVPNCVTATPNANDLAWLTSFNRDGEIVQSDMQLFGVASHNEDVRGVEIYGAMLARDAGNRLKNSQQYIVLGELKDVKISWELAMALIEAGANDIVTSCTSGDATLMAQGTNLFTLGSTALELGTSLLHDLTLANQKTSS